MVINYFQEQVPFGMLTTCVVILLCFLVTNKKKKVKEPLDVHLLNRRILEFRPDPLINPDTLKTIHKEVIEKMQPDESSPDCLNLVKVNYLNLLNSNEIKHQAEECIRMYGVGSCGPRGFYGTIDVHLNLESCIAEFMGMEETVLYSYGFSTIASAIGAYCKKSDIIFCDECISFSAMQGFIAAKSKVLYFKHNDMFDLECKLKEYEEKENEKKKLYRKFLIVEGIYKKTGTICPLPKLMELRKQYKLRIFIDETLSIGVLGRNGRGVTEHFNVDRSDVDMIMGSLEGSVGSIGGFCVGASVVIEHQRLSGLGYCFSASLPPFLCYISTCAFNMFKGNPTIFKKLETVSTEMDKKLRSLEHFNVISDAFSPIKVISLDSDNAINDINLVHAYCVGKKLYTIKNENKLSFNINVEFDEKQMIKVVDILREACTRM